MAGSDDVQVINTGSDQFDIVVNHYGDAKGTKDQFQKSDPSRINPLIEENYHAAAFASETIAPRLQAIRTALAAAWEGEQADRAMSIIETLTTDAHTIATNANTCRRSFEDFQQTWSTLKSRASGLYEGVAGTGLHQDNDGAHEIYRQFNAAMDTAMHTMPSQLQYHTPLDQQTAGPGPGPGPGPGGPGPGGYGPGPGNYGPGPGGMNPGHYGPGPSLPSTGGTHGPGPGTYGPGPGTYGPGPGGTTGGYGPGGIGLDTGSTLAGLDGGAGGYDGGGGLGGGGLGAGGGVGGGLGAGGGVGGGLGAGGGAGAGLGGAESAVAGYPGGGAGVGGAGAAGAGAGGRGMMMPMHGSGGNDEDERERSTWLSEDDDLWGGDDAAPSVIS
jgi:hypothetical protein